MTMTPVSVRPKVQPWVGSVPDDASTVFSEANRPTIANAAAIGANRPTMIARPSITLYHGTLAFRPANALPLLLAASPNAYSTSLNPCGPALFMLATPEGRMTEIAVGIRQAAFGSSTPITAHVATHAPSFLPRYSGVRPIISPAMNTAIKTWNNMQYTPQPIPPNMISPIRMFHIGIMPANGIQLSCIELTEPLSIAVQDTPQRTLFITPNRSSFPSRSGWTFPTTGFGRVSAHHATPNESRNNASITANRHHACFRLPTSRPNI